LLLKINRLNTKFPAFLVLVLAVYGQSASAQMITGVWKGKINRQRVEVKIVQDGDSLRGSSYYYESSNNYRRYSIKGYFDPTTNEAVWWDDQLVDQRPANGGKGRMPMMSRADFNCPGDGRMMLDGKSGKITDELKGDVHLDKTETGLFTDEWDFVIDNYLVGASDPYIIDSIGSLVLSPLIPEKEVVVVPKIEKTTPFVAKQDPPVAREEVQKEIVKTPVVIPVLPPQTIEEKFISRKKILTTEIPIAGDSIELRFYDNAEIDGDSISLFLNEKLIFTHIRLTGTAYTIKIPTVDLGQSNELIMVAENLGSIPPNTSYMVAIVNEKRYEARLESSEGSSAMVRFVKQKE
jgi:hypothetical protein